MRYILVSFDRKEEFDNASFFKEYTLKFSCLLSPVVTIKSNLLLKVEPQFFDGSYDTLEAAKQECREDKIDFIVEYNEKRDNVVIGVYDNFFTQSNKATFYCVETNHIYLHEGKYAGIFSKDRVMISFSYALLKELCFHNSVQKEFYQRGLSMLEFLYRNPPAELYRLTKRSYSPSLISKLLLEKILVGNKTDIIQPLRDEINRKPNIPQINLDHFDLDDMRYALENVGTFELVGEAINKLNKAAENALSLCNDILNLPKTVLNMVPNEGFNGFQNVRKETKAKFKKTGSGFIRNQIAFHCKPYLGVKAPGNLNLKPYVEYYEQGLVLLHTLYRYIAISYKIHPDTLISYLNDQKSVLTTRKYFPKKEGETGIPPHSDYGLLTLVVSDEKGLEVERDGKWYSAPCTPGLRFYVNFGDWFGFQLRNLGVACKMGIHRVPEVDKVRHSLALFLNPNRDQIVKVPNGEEITYETYLTSPKVPYIIQK